MPTLVVTKLDRLARSLPDARATAEGSPPDKSASRSAARSTTPTDAVGRLLFNVLAMVVEFESDSSGFAQSTG
jgi:DNA invertase Pin-like site-specific DNA recombinase